MSTQPGSHTAISKEELQHHACRHAQHFFCFAWNFKLPPIHTQFPKHCVEIKRQFLEQRCPRGSKSSWTQPPLHQQRNHPEQEHQQLPLQASLLQHREQELRGARRQQLKALKMSRGHHPRFCPACVSFWWIDELAQSPWDGTRQWILVDGSYPLRTLRLWRRWQPSLCRDGLLAQQEIVDLLIDSGHICLRWFNLPVLDHALGHQYIPFLQDGIFIITDRLRCVSAFVLAIGQFIMRGEQIFVNILYLDPVHGGIIILAGSRRYRAYLPKTNTTVLLSTARMSAGLSPGKVRRSSVKNSSIVMDILLLSSLGSSSSWMSFAAFARQQFFASFTSL